MIAFLRRLWTFARPYRPRLILGMVCGIVYALANGALVVVVKFVVNAVFPGSGDTSPESHLQRAPMFLRPILESAAHWLPSAKSFSSNSGMALIICTVPVVMLVRGVFAYLNVYLMNRSAVGTVADLRARLFDHLQNLSLDFFSSARTGELISRIINDTQALNNIISNALASIVKDPISILTLVLVLVLQEPKLTLISLIVLPLCLAPVIIYGRKVRSSGRATQAHAAELASLMHESFTANRIIKAYNLEPTVLAQFRQCTKKYVSQMMRALRANEIPSQSTEFLASLAVALVFIYVVFVANKSSKQMTPGDLLAFIGSVFLMYQPIKSLVRLHNQLEQARAASLRIFDLLELRSKVADPPHAVPLVAAGADIRFESLDFDYGEKPVLRGINFTVKAGQLVALVGGSGSGKTTLTNLLLRFYDPQGGTVRIGPTDIRQVAIKDLRNHIALVSQEPILFNDTIRANIALGSPGATDAQIEAAAKCAHAHEFISQKDEGYLTVVGEKGAALSGGQRQRIAIARAILKDAPILILDEATNALDAESERAVQAGLEELMQGRTTICIAHRLSTVQNADLIVVLDQGRIVESGTHVELLERRGLYSRLYELQFEPVLA
jgi:subfamily B ATP-binding cassette protein MsbA